MLFEKCEHVGCERCKIYKICFMCIIDKILRNDLTCNKFKLNFKCINCKVRGMRYIKLPCNHSVCLQCCSSAKLLDYNCSECYFKEEKKFCVNCFKRYTIIGVDDDLLKDCCGLSLKISQMTGKNIREKVIP